MSEITCSICFFPISVVESFTCSKKKCNLLVCHDCMESLITYSQNNNLIPSCPDNNCHGIYIISELEDISLDSKKLYGYACLNYFMNTEGDNIKKTIAEKEIIEKIRAERLIFLEKYFPKGIVLTSKLTFSRKIKILDKQKEKIIKSKVKSAERSCLFTTCNGFLDNNFICLTCDTSFCKKCEKKKNSGHICKKDDIDSVNIVNDMIRCPECKLPVFKDIGCDNITCSVCGTKFLYSTGERGGSGSSNARITTNIFKEKKISSYYADIIPKKCLNKIIELEELQPKKMSKNILIKPVHLYITKKNKNVAANKLAKNLDLYTRNQRDIIDYHKYVTKIENLLINKENEKIILKKLNKILKKLDTKN